MKKCTQCGTMLSDETKFCSNCGFNVESETPAATNVQTQEDDPTVTLKPAEVMAEKSEQLKALIDENVKPKFESLKSKIDKKTLKIVGIAAAVIVLLIVIIALITKGGKGDTIDFEKLPLMYEKDGEILYRINGESKSKVLAEDDEFYDFKISDDGERFFLLMTDDDGEKDLYYRDLDKKDPDKANKLIEKGVSQFVHSSDGSAVFYTKNGNLYRSNLKKSVKYASDVYDYEIADDFKAVVYENEDGDYYYTNGKYNKKLGEISQYYFVDDDSKIVYTEYNDDGEEDLYIIGVGKNDKKQKLLGGIDDYVVCDDDYKTFYYIKNDNLYFKSGSKKAVKVLDDASNIYSKYGDDDKDEEFFVVDDDDTLYYLENKKATKLCKDFADYIDFDWTIIATYDDDYDMDYYLRNGKKLYKLDTPKDVDLDDASIKDGYIYYLDDIDDDNGSGSLMACKIGSKNIKFDKAKELTDDVEHFGFDSEADRIYIYKEDDSFGVYNGKKYIEISNDYTEVIARKDKEIIFIEDGDTICYFNGKKSKEIAEDVVTATAYGMDYIYFLNEEDELYQLKKSGKSKMLDDDVDYLSDFSSVLGRTATYNFYY